MPNPIFFTACLLAICLPILSVQLPRTAFYTRLRSNPPETRSTRCSETTDKTTTTRNTIPPPPPSPQHQPQHRRHKESSPQPAPEFVRRRSTAAREQTEATAQNFDGTHSGAASAEEEGGDVSPRRKPWDPPYPRRESVRVGSWRILPPVPRRERGSVVEEEERNVAEVNGEGGRENVPLGRSVQEVGGGEQRGDTAGAEKKSKGMLLVWVGAAIVAVLLFLLAFAVLIAHCLAWFLVYKTEARLGEARRGIMMSGDMRLCLCAA
ncbi:hypothetical protein T440DRAFT_256730 [Plenodomus tracheiphilus IPT5]|uniref:Transmembrane protein n=1 Tax=Plenodomus tracheiphilus IPT5 TaxID=1408161 RepID=A0A6A7ARQ1_9PLEO|nr:hypothetical protein T440DRAFT_256730 [Plenodomus tracheiphilus IPT5]